MLIFTVHASACDPVGPPPEPWPAKQAALEMLQGKYPEFTHVFYGTIVGKGELPNDVYLIEVTHPFRGGLKGRLRASIGTTSCHSVRPTPGLKVVLYGQDNDALQIAGSMYGDLVPTTEVLYPALLQLEKQQKGKPAIESRSWWKFW